MKPLGLFAARGAVFEPVLAAAEIVGEDMDAIGVAAEEVVVVSIDEPAVCLCRLLDALTLEGELAPTSAFVAVFEARRDVTFVH